MRLIVIIILTFMATLAQQSCKKKEAVQAQDNEGVKGNASAVIVNKLADTVYLTLSGLDIATGTLPHVLQLTLPPGDSTVVPRADLKDAYKYGYDWHTADYTYSSWLVTDATGKPKNLSFDYYGEAEDYKISVESAKRMEMLICLEGDGLSSTWEAVDAYDATGASVWATLSDRERKHSFVVSRYHTSRHQFIDTPNTPRTNLLSFSLDMSLPRMWLKVDHPAEAYVLCNDLAPHLALSTQARDTLYYSRCLPDSTGIVYPPPYYVLKRVRVER